MLDAKPKKKKQKTENQSEAPDAWEVLAKRKRQGLWDGEIEIRQIKSFNLSKGKHYFVIEDPHSGSVKCISCPITHGGILEAHLLHRYKIEGGVLYFDGKPLNQPAKLDNDEPNG